MKYSVVKVVNGNYAIAILDENLDAYQGYKEHIHHDPVVEEPTEEVATEEE